MAEAPTVFTERVEGPTNMTEGVAVEAVSQVPLLRFGG